MAIKLSSFYHLLIPSSLSEILTSVEASRKEVEDILRRQREIREEAGLISLFSLIDEIIMPLRQYSEDAPLLSRTEPLSDALNKIEKLRRSARVTCAEPFLTILVEVLSSWEKLLRYEINEIRRLKGKAKLICSTSKEVMPDNIITIVLEIHNCGPASASNIHVTLICDGLIEIKPPVYALLSLTPNEKRILTFLAHSMADTFIAEFHIIYDDLQKKYNEQTFTVPIAIRDSVHKWEYITNPYFTGGQLDMKTVGQLFVGRQDILHFIKENLFNVAHGRIVVLYGHRRTGKTWTLIQLQKYIPSSFIPVYIDVQGITGLKGIPSVLQYIADVVITAIKDTSNINKKILDIRIPTIEDYEKNYAYQFEKVFLSDVKKVIDPQKILWMLDEFQGLDDMVLDKKLPSTFMEFLRHLMQFGGDMAFIFAGTREMTSQYWSVFFNIAIHRKLGVLSDVDAEKLIIDPVKPLGVLHDRFAVPFIKQLTGNHPYFIQLLCDKIVYELNARHLMLVNVQVIEASAEALVFNDSSNLKFYWSEVMNEEERAVTGVMHMLSKHGEVVSLTNILKEMNQINPRVSRENVVTALTGLIEKEIIEKDKALLDAYKFKIGLVERYIGMHVTYDEIRGRVNNLW